MTDDHSTNPRPCDAENENSPSSVGGNDFWLRRQRSKDSSAFANYVQVRNALLALMDSSEARRHQASDYWREELAGFEYMFDASPFVVDKLRHHCYHLTGIHEYGYRNHHSHSAGPYAEKKAMLRQRDKRGLWTPESPALGGFGFDVDGGLVNIDTLKFYEVLIGMETAGLLPAAGDPTRRRVLEIGAGWGGFAYQYKKLFPNTNYLIVDLPGTMLFSATYLKTVFPDSKVAIATAGSLQTLLADPSLDFLFVPAFLWESAALPKIDLAINMVSFQEMTSEQVEGYVSKLAQSGCQHLYSLNRDRSGHNTQLTSVSEIAGKHFSLSPVEVLPIPYTQLKDSGKRRELGVHDYRHQSGRRWQDAARKPSERKPKVVLGMPLYNQTEFLPAALESLLAQSHADFSLVVVDDSTTNEPGRIIARYAAKDPRISYVKNVHRLGMIDNWRKTFELAGPDVEFFAWVSDHDLWHEHWLESMVAGLESDPQAALCYPYSPRMDERGVRLNISPVKFDSSRLPLAQRTKKLCQKGNGVGTMVYGLFRATMLRRAGVFRRTLLPDLLLMTEISLLGGVKQVPKELWRRRHAGLFSVARQRKSLFVRQPWYVRIPIPVTWTHTVMILWLHAVGPNAGTTRERVDGLRLAGTYLYHLTIVRMRRLWNRTKKSLAHRPGYQFAKQVHHRLRRAA